MQTPVAPSCYSVNVVSADFAVEIIIVSRYELGLYRFSERPLVTIWSKTILLEDVTRQLSRDPRFVRRVNS